MGRVKQMLLIGFCLLWVFGFLLVAPSPLYRFLFSQANDIDLNSPIQLFESLDWSHPYYYEHIGRAFRELSQQAEADEILVYFERSDPFNTNGYIRYFREYQIAWAYPRVTTRIPSLDNIEAGQTIMVSAEHPPPQFTCISHEENLHLCQS